MSRVLTKTKNIIINPMFVMMALTAVVYFFIQYFRVPTNVSTFDYALFYFIAGVSLLSAIFMVIRTSWDGWSILGSGLVAHFLAVGFVYFLSAWYADHAVDSYTHELIVFARSLLIVSGVFVLNGVIEELVEGTPFDVRCWAVRVWKKVRRR